MLRWFQALLPREEAFFDLFEAHAKTLCAGARALRDLLEQGGDVVPALCADIARHGDPEPPSGATIPELIAGRDWLFEDDAYHIDVSHLGAVVRYSPMARDEPTLRRYRRHPDHHHPVGCAEQPAAEVPV